MKKKIILGVVIVCGIALGLLVFKGSIFQPAKIATSANLASSNAGPAIEFSGEKGEKVVLENNSISLAATVFDDNQAHFYNIEMPNGKTVYFFVIKDKGGTIRAAANSCQVCYSARKGFRQEGNEMVCNNCGTRYPLEKIATEKGGCNPGPINPDLKAQNGRIIINQTDIEQVLDLF